MSDIIRKRGDTRRIQKTVRENGVAIDISGWTFTLTINREEDPSDASEEVAQLIGVIVIAGDGTVKFTPTLTDVDWVGTYFYDIEAIDADGGVSTLDKGRWVNTQDITKSDEIFEWTPDEVPADGSLAVVDGSEGLMFTSNSFPEFGASTRDLMTYETRDTRRVIRCMVEPYNSFAFCSGYPRGPEFSRFRFPLGSWEVRITGYIKLASLQLYGVCDDGMSYFRAYVDSRGGGALEADCSSWMLKESEGGTFQLDPAAIDTSGWVDDDWYVVGLRFAPDEIPSYMVKRESDADSWIDLDVAVTFPSVLFPQRIPHPALVREDAEPTSVIDLWKYEWRRL